MQKKNLNMFIINLILISTFLLMLINFRDFNNFIWIFVLSFVFVIIYMMLSVKLFSASFFFIIFYIMLFYLQPMILPMLGVNLTNDIETYRVLIALIILGLHFFIMGNCLLNNKSFELEPLKFDQKSISNAISLLLIVTLLSIVVSFIQAGTINILSLSRLELKGSNSLLTTLGFYSTSIMFFLVAATVKSRSISNRFKWIIIFILLEIIIFLLFRTRSLMVVHISSLLVGIYYSNYFSNKPSNVKVSTKLFIFITAIASVIIAISLRFVRGYIQPGGSVSNFQFDIRNFLEQSLMSGDLGYSSTVLQVINYVPSYHDYLGGQSYYRFLFTPIPRSIWEDKPENTQQIVADWLTPESAGEKSLPPGVIGDLYINFGVLGVFLMVVFGLFIGLLDRKITLKNTLVWASSATWIFHLVRGGFTNPIIIFLFLLIIIILLDKFVLNREYGGRREAIE